MMASLPFFGNFPITRPSFRWEVFQFVFFPPLAFLPFDIIFLFLNITYDIIYLSKEEVDQVPQDHADGPALGQAADWHVRWPDHWSQGLRHHFDYRYDFWKEYKNKKIC